jgi:hypothetical protein
MMDFTFSNASIKDYFERGANPPTSELLYLHAHPLIKPNFINQLEKMMSEVGGIMVDKGIRGKTLDDLYQMALRIGEILPVLDRTNAADVLLEMRKAYTLGKSLGVSITD